MGRTAPFPLGAAKILRVLDWHSGDGGGLLSPLRLEEIPTPRLPGLRPLQDWQAFAVTSHPGLVLARGLLTTEAQLAWLSRALRSYPLPPNRTNLDKSPSAQLLGQERQGDGGLLCGAIPLCGTATNIAGLSIFDDQERLKKLRWTTLGYHYDWDDKVYREEDRTPFPEELAQLSEAIVAVLGFPHFRAEACIVNYYPPKTTLSGHVDRSEWTLRPPLLSLSLGQSAVYLQGGLTLQEVVNLEEPLALYLRSGDVLLMEGEQRQVYHGVPLLLQDMYFEDREWDDAATEDSALLAYARHYRVNFTVRQLRD